MPKISAAQEEATRQRIVDAALRAFRQHGFHAATIQDVVRESGLSVGAIYSYFSGKDELLEVCCDMALAAELDLLAAEIAPARTVREKLEIGVRYWFDYLDRHDEAAFIVQAFAAAGSSPTIRAMLVRRRERLAAVGTMLLREGIARGELPSWLDVDAMARGFTALLDGIALQAMEEGDGFRRAIAERRATVFLELLYAAAEATQRPRAASTPTV
jgi:TetR/AcrR family transcriptional regulator, transcriptional repressor of aconitase